MSRPRGLGGEVLDRKRLKDQVLRYKEDLRLRILDFGRPRGLETQRCQRDEGGLEVEGSKGVEIQRELLEVQMPGGHTRAHVRAHI